MDAAIKALIFTYIYFTSMGITVENIKKSKHFEPKNHYFYFRNDLELVGAIKTRDTPYDEIRLKPIRKIIVEQYNSFNSVVLRINPKNQYSKNFFSMRENDSLVVENFSDNRGYGLIITNHTLDVSLLIFTKGQELDKFNCFTEKIFALKDSALSK